MRFSGRQNACLLLALVLLLAAGCAGGGGPASTLDASPDATTSASDESPSTEGTDSPVKATQPPGGNAGETFLAWIVGLGPGSPEGPTQVDMYQLIEQGTQESCRQALDPELDDAATKSLYDGAAAACLAALHGKNARWTEAEDAFRSLPGRPTGCVDRATFDLLESIVAAHRADADAVFTRDGQPGDGGPDRVRLRCPRMTDVTVARAPNGALEIDVEGTRLNQVLQISYDLVDECPQPVDREAGPMLEAVGDDDALHATVPGDDATVAASWIWIGLIAEPVDWIAASDCLPIPENQPV